VLADIVQRVTAVWILIAMAAVAAVADWLGVGTANDRLQYAAKPAVLALLLAAAALIPAAHSVSGGRRGWFVIALSFCLVGDVFLMLPRNLFVPGLAAFLVGHAFFIVGLLQPASSPSARPFAFSSTGLALCATLVVVVEILPAFIIIRSILRHGQGVLVGPVCLYMAAILTMVVLATNVGRPAAAVGAAFFLVSDTLLATDRFVRPIRHGTLLVHITYHVAQVLLVVSLIR
jgi:uncharacterized membrane protein YhhN